MDDGWYIQTYQIYNSEFNSQIYQKLKIWKKKKRNFVDKYRIQYVEEVHSVGFLYLTDCGAASSQITTVKPASMEDTFTWQRPQTSIYSIVNSPGLFSARINEIYRVQIKPLDCFHCHSAPLFCCCCCCCCCCLHCIWSVSQPRCLTFINQLQ